MRFLFLIVFASCTNPAVKEVKDPHSYVNFEQVQRTHLYWDAFVDVAKRYIEASEELTIQQLQKSEELVLDTRGSDIKSFVVAPANRKFESTNWGCDAGSSLKDQKNKFAEISRAHPRRYKSQR